MREKEEYRKRIGQIKEENPFVSQMDIAYEIVLEDILTGVLAAGEKVNQENMAALFGMSRTPVREALLKLEEEGFVLKNERAGYQVYRLILKDYVDFCEFRIQIETFGAYLAARSITPGQLRRLKQNMDAFIHACDEGRTADVLVLDEEFHSLLMEASDNAYVVQAYERMKKKKNLYTRYIMRKSSLPFMKRQHMEIYKAIVSFDEERSRDLMRSHLAFYIKNLYNVMAD